MLTRKVLQGVLACFLVAAMLAGCGGDQGGPEEPSSPEKGEGGSEDFPAKDPAQPFAIGEKGTVTLANDQTYEIQVQRGSGEPLFLFSIKKSGVIDPQVTFTVQTIQVDMPEELAASYVPLEQVAFEMHVVGESGYGFALRPKIQFFFGPEIAAAKEKGAALEPLKGNLIVLYKEQRAPKWVPQTSVSVDEAGKVVTLSNVAGSGAWWLVAKKGE
jgi:hypothetical protein